MKFPQHIDVAGYNGVSVRHADETVTLTIHDDDSKELEVILYADESRALRKALKAAEKEVESLCPRQK